MHIGFDISQTGSQKAGCGYYAHALIRAMTDIAPQHQFSLFQTFGDFFFDPPALSSSPAGKHVKIGPSHLTREAAGAFWYRDDLEQALGQPDIIHGNNFWTPIQLKSSRLIYTLYDLGFAENPGWTTEANRIGCFEGVFRASIAADWIIAISEASKAHFLKVFPHFQADRIRVIYPCSRFTDVDEQGSRPDAMAGIQSAGFWLSVGTIEPRKNQRLLAQAYALYLNAGGPAMPLVFAGGKGWLMEDFHHYIEELGIQRHVKLLGYITDEELIWLYRNCYGNLYPSIFEGFGLPVLEGMQFGAATLSSNTTSMPEVAGNAAILLPPAAPEAWAKHMVDLAANQNQRASLRTAAQQQAAQFSWHNSANAILALYGDAINSPKRSSTMPSRAAGAASA